MNYCSVEEAWGTNFNRQGDSDSMSSISNTSVDSKIEYRKYKELKEKYENKDSMCTEMFTHINQCPECRAKIHGFNAEPFTVNGFSKSIIDTLKNNSDVLTLALLIILFILFVKVIFN